MGRKELHFLVCEKTYCSQNITLLLFRVKYNAATRSILYCSGKKNCCRGESGLLFRGKTLLSQGKRFVVQANSYTGLQFKDKTKTSKDKLFERTHLITKMAGQYRSGEKQNYEWDSTILFREKQIVSKRNARWYRYKEESTEFLTSNRPSNNERFGEGEHDVANTTSQYSSGDKYTLSLR